MLTLLPHFEEITFENFPKEENQLADVLATMSSMFKVRWDNEAPHITIEKLDEPAHCCDIETEEVADKPWFHEVKRYLEAQEYPEGASVNDKKFLRRFAAKLFLSNGILYKLNHDSTLLRCVDKSEVARIMTDLCEGTSEPILVDIPWIRISYRQDINGPLWKSIVISTLELIISAKSMLIQCMCLRSP